MLNHKRPFGLCPVGWNPRSEPWGCHTLQGSSKYRKRLMCTSSAQQTQRSPLSVHPSPGIRGELQKPPGDSSPQPFKTFQQKDSEESTSFVYCPKIHNQNLIVKKKSKQIILKNNWPTYFEKYQYQASLMVQWLKIHLPIPGTWVLSLLQDNPTCHVAAKLECHNSWSLCAQGLCSTTREAWAPQLERRPHSLQLAKAYQQWRPSTARNKSILKKSTSIMKNKDWETSSKWKEMKETWQLLNTLHDTGLDPALRAIFL